MRLIDADKLIEVICDRCTSTDCGRDGVRVCTDVKIIRSQPTAYDVDKVVDELENVACCKNIPTYDNPYTSGSIIDEDDAINIVRRGGKE